MFDNPAVPDGTTQGNVQRLPGGGEIVNWGSQRWFTEFGPAGRVLWNARLALRYESYRGYRLPWVGLPHMLPRTARVRRSGGGMDVCVSSNGATEVAGWDASEDPRPTAWRRSALTGARASRRPCHRRCERRTWRFGPGMQPGACSGRRPHGA